jgi:hypothetical protein
MPESGSVEAGARRQQVCSLCGSGTFRVGKNQVVSVTPIPAIPPAMVTNAT